MGDELRGDSLVHLNVRFSTEAELKQTLDFLYVKSKEGISFTGLIEAMVNEVTIVTAIHNIKSNKGSKTAGIDQMKMDKYLQMPKEELIALIRDNFSNYRPKPAKRVYIPKKNGKKRPLGIPTVLDRIIQECVRIIIEPICEARFYPHSYGFRPYRAQKHAVRDIINVINASNAGLSLGEYTALAASNVIDIKDLFLLVKKRGKYMQEAFPTGGAMAAVIGLSEREVVAICNQMNGNIYIANYNCPGQIVVTGEKAVVEASYEIFQKKGAKMVLPLNVSGPFHSPLLETAKKKLEISLKDVQINNFIIPYVSNVNAKYINYSCDIKSLLSEQIVSSVKWQQSIKEMIRQGVDLFIEVGPGSTLTNLIRKIDPGVEVLNIQAVGDMKTLLKVN